MAAFSCDSHIVFFFGCVLRLKVGLAVKNKTGGIGGGRGGLVSSGPTEEVFFVWTLGLIWA